tara:strand:- start:4944 stop:5687 length:744 start_codon:yes stop_codon:yes gene_type:complete
MIKIIIKLLLKINPKFLLLEIYTRNFQDGFLLNLLILSSIKKPKIVELGAHGHNQGLIGLSSHIFLNGEYLLLDAFQNNLNEINLITNKYKLKNIYTKKFFINPKTNPEKLDNFIKEKMPNFEFADLLIMDIDGYERNILKKLNFFSPFLIFVEENKNFKNSIAMKQIKKKKYFSLGTFDGNFIFCKKKIINKEINFKKTKLNKLLIILLKINSKFFLGLFIKIHNKNYEIKELIDKPNQFNNVVKY